MDPIKYAIVGVGPRGGFALERLVAALSELEEARPARITLFEESSYPGSGPVYSPAGSPTNWVNVTERVLVLDGRTGITLGDVQLPSFPSYHEWGQFDVDAWPVNQPDTFPPRGRIGRYMHERFCSLADPLVAAGVAVIERTRVDRVSFRDGTCWVGTATNPPEAFDEVLLTVGHQPTEPDEQLSAWAAAVQSHDDLTLHEEPYPVSNYAGEGAMTDVHRVAIRGYGLAMIDAARALAARFGTFTVVDPQTREQTYSLHGPPLVIAPFSLDGLTMGAKPLNAAFDSQFEPTNDEVQELEARIGDREAQSAASSVRFLTAAMAPVIARRFVALERPAAAEGLGFADVAALVERWLLDPDVEHSCIMRRDTAPEAALETFINIATGASDVPLDYCAGQTWRLCYTSFRRSLSHGSLSDAVFAEIIALDERLKRYSFGAPVESHQQLKALCKAGVLNLDVLKDPDIDCGPSGWTLRAEGGEFTARTMIDSVLDDPRIKKVRSPLISNLLDEGMMQAVDHKLGAATDPHGYVQSEADDRTLPIALLGRLAKGSVIGVDAITECFGERPDAWARAAARRAKW